MSRPDDRPESDGPRPPPRRGLAALLAGFMEEHNILWGELVGGLLVVGCSTALVISLWHTLSENPLFKFATFTGAVAAVFGAGLYTLRRWRLESTSRGLLVVGTLLTPVCQLALTLEGAERGLDVLLAVASPLLLGALVWRAARVLAPAGPALLALSVVLTSGCQLAAVRLVHPGEPGTVLPLALLPAAVYAVVTALLLLTVTRRGPPDGATATSLLTHLGLTAFPLL